MGVPISIGPKRATAPWPAEYKRGQPLIKKYAPYIEVPKAR